MTIIPNSTGSTGENYFDEEAASSAPVFTATKSTVVNVDGADFLVMETDQDCSFVFRGTAGNPNGDGAMTAFNPMRRKVLAAYRSL